MSDPKLAERAMALAAIAQAASAVDQLARSGYLHTDSLATAVHSLFEQHPPDTAAVFGGAHKVAPGARLLVELLRAQVPNDRQQPMLNYCLALLHLQKQLARRPRMLQDIDQRLQQARLARDHFGPTHDSVIANLAGIYTSTLSTLSFRIHVVGEYQYLQQQRAAEQIRVLLFAGVRAALLWRQLGGSRWQLLWERKRLLEAAQRLAALHPSDPF